MSEIRHSRLAYLWEVEAPWVYVGFGEPERTPFIPSYFYAKPGVDTCVRVLRGNKMRDVQGLMNEFGAALQFFDGFGENWGALEDCLRCMDEWLPADAYVLVVERAELLLIDEADDRLRNFLATIQAAGTSWAEPVDFPEWFKRPPLPFHLLLNVQEGHPEGIERLVAAFERQGVPIRTDRSEAVE